MTRALTISDAESMGMDGVRLERAGDLVRRGLEQKLYSAAVWMVLRHGRVVLQGCCGAAQPEHTAAACSMQTVFDAASISKTITAVLLLQAVEEGLLHLEQQCGAFLPGAADTAVGRVTLKMLATHTSGLPAWAAVHETANPLQTILHTSLEAEPGSRYAYSDLGYILLGSLLEQVLQAPLPELARKRIFQPLGMDSSCYNPPEHMHERLAATTAPLGQVHDPNARGMGGAAGHAGLFSTAQDLAVFALAVHPHSHTHLPDTPPALSLLARSLVSTRQTAPPLSAHTIGWFAWPNGYLPLGDLLSRQTFGHTGFTGTMLLIDPVHDLVIVLLTNRVYYERENDGSAVLTQRRLFANLIGAALR